MIFLLSKWLRIGRERKREQGQAPSFYIQSLILENINNSTNITWSSDTRHCTLGFIVKKIHAFQNLPYFNKEKISAEKNNRTLRNYIIFRMLFIRGGWILLYNSSHTPWPGRRAVPSPSHPCTSNSCYFSSSSASIINCATDSPPYPTQRFPFLDKICGNVLFTSLEWDS